MATFPRIVFLTIVVVFLVEAANAQNSPADDRTQRRTAETYELPLENAPLSLRRRSQKNNESKSSRKKPFPIPHCDIASEDGDWTQWGGSSHRNNTPIGTNIPLNWDVESGRNIKWTAKLGSQTYGTPVVSNGRIFVGTNNRHGHVDRSKGRDGTCLLCLDETDGRFLWQHLNEKLATGRMHDVSEQGLVSVPAVCGDRLWYVTNRGEVVCLDTEGFADGENDGSFTSEPVRSNDEADVIWQFDMMAELGVRPHNQFTCSVTYSDTAVFVVTGNGVGPGHAEIQAEAPDFIALDRTSGKLLWADSSVGRFTLHGSWSSPALGVFGEQAQVLFPGGDGWLYSFDPAGGGNGAAKLLWKFDCNPKDSVAPSYLGDRCEFLTAPVIYDGKVYVATGTDIEHGAGPGRIWCIDPVRKLDGSDVSPVLAVDSAGNRLARQRLRAIDPEAGDITVPNPDSALVWDYTGFDFDADGKIHEDESWQRTCATVTIKDNLLFAVNVAGFIHCLEAATGQAHWHHDLYANTWHVQPLIVEGKVYFGDEDGELAVFAASAQKTLLAENIMDSAIYASPIVANDVLFVTDRSKLYAIKGEVRAAVVK